ncbi:class 3 adenylate cyclase [Mycobacterium sp. OAS707]|uniref:AAA family ATPase n=1 Tax=Mycobacterium sp. OAS707 TaxID=2663822 RepID=UPI0017891176|nr:class 3 adenylate cyclase [Mycobacterium sp. OAS707]
MATPCGTCGAEPREGARFCDACGSPVASIESRAEYKQVTVLFADVVHSMDIAATLGAERLREIMGELFNRCSAIVHRYGGTVDKFTGDGLMAVFGAPIALEDHAVRACRAALDIQKDVKSLDDEVERRDHVVLQLRIGLNSGGVITGEIGSGPLAYTAVGEQVGMAQRMESAAPPGGVMVSESTARLVENATMLGDPELVHIKGGHEPVPARRLLGIASGRRATRVETTFVGRDWEMAALRGLLERAVNGRGCVVSLVGPPGIGKTRMLREICSCATDMGVEVATTLCESHTADIPFHAAGALLRATTNAQGLTDDAARAQIRERFSGAEEEDLIILEDLLGIGDPAAALPMMDPDARRRRIAAMVNAAALARDTPTVYVIEDAHWIDDISESMLSDFIAVVPRTRSLVLITYRPEYSGALTRAPRMQTIALEPLDDAHMSKLSTELLGEDRSVAELADLVAERAGGNPFFAEEIVRDLRERDVLIGGRGCYLCVEPARDVNVPSTLQAVIASRIDRLDPAAKRALNAAAVIGSQFGPEMLEALQIEPALSELVAAELIDQTAFAPRPQFAFRHGLIRAVAYESQLKSDRAQLHRRLAETIEPDDQNAALIAEHLEAAGDPRAAYEWHMRAGAWSIIRDITAARTSWSRARDIADALPADDPDRLRMRIAPRTQLCATTYRSASSFADSGFGELRDLCSQADDKRSLAMGMLGEMTERMARGRVRDASRLATEHEALLEAIGDSDFMVGMCFGPMAIKQETREMDDILRWSELNIALAKGDPTKGNFLVGSPLAIALAFRGVARYQLGISGWRNDFDDAAEMARGIDPLTYASVIVYKYAAAVGNGVLLADDDVLAELDEMRQIAVNFADHNAVGLTTYTLALALLEGASDRDRALKLLSEVRQMCENGSFFKSELPLIALCTAREQVRGGDFRGVAQAMQTALDAIYDNEQYAYCSAATRLFVETLLEQGDRGALAQAETAVDRLAAAPLDGVVVRDITVMQLRAMLARARGDEGAYGDLRDRYRDMATELGFEGHMAWAAAMP